MESKKKVAAAISAVTQYIRTEEEAIHMQSLAAVPVDEVPAAAAGEPVKLWGMSGRQAQMQMRNLMQMKTFK